LPRGQQEDFGGSIVLHFDARKSERGNTFKVGGIYVGVD